MSPDQWAAIGGIATIAGSLTTLGVWRWQVVARREDQEQAALGQFLFPRRATSKEFEILPLMWAAYLDRKLPEVQVTVWLVNYRNKDLTLLHASVGGFAISRSPAERTIPLDGISQNTDTKLVARSSGQITIHRPLNGPEVQMLRDADLPRYARAEFRLSAEWQSGNQSRRYHDSAGWSEILGEVHRS